MDKAGFPSLLHLFLTLDISQVMVLVPTLTPVDDGYLPMARASYPSYSHGYYQHHPNVAPHHGPPAPEYGMPIQQGRPPPPTHYHSAQYWGQPRPGAPPPQHHAPDGRQFAQQDGGSPGATVRSPGRAPRSHSGDHRG